MKIPSLFLLVAGLSCAAWPVLADEAFEPPVPVRMIAPVYPVELRRIQLTGIVTINCLIDEKGNVQEPKVEKASNDAFVQPALEAVRKWKFKPAKKSGAAFALRVSIPIKFNITDD